MYCLIDWGIFFKSTSFNHFAFIMFPDLKLGSHHFSDLRPLTVSVFLPILCFNYFLHTGSSSYSKSKSYILGGLPDISSCISCYDFKFTFPPQICSPSDFLISINGSIIFPTRNWTHSCSMSLYILIISICQRLFSTVSCVIFPILILMSLAQDLTSHLILSYS